MNLRLHRQGSLCFHVVWNVGEYTVTALTLLPLLSIAAAPAKVKVTISRLPETRTSPGDEAGSMSTIWGTMTVVTIILFFSSPVMYWVCMAW